MPRLVLVAMTSLLFGLGCGADTSTRAPDVRAEYGVAARALKPTVAPVVLEPGLLVIDWSEREGWDPGWAGAARGALVPIEPATAGDVPGVEPISVGQAGSVTPSPDGSLLALTRHVTQSSGGELVVIDARTFEERFEPSLPPRVGRVAWSGDSRYIYATRAIRLHPNPMDEVWRVDAETGERTLLASLDYEVLWHQPFASPEGERQYLLGRISGQCCGLDVKGPPFLAALDARTGEELGRVELPEVLTVQRLEETERGQYDARYFPATVLAPDGSRIYVVHADEDRVTIIDPERMQVLPSVGLRTGTSPLARFGSWLFGLFAGRAEAKGGLEFWRQAAISNDGRWLYISGSRDVTCKEVQYSYCERRPAGLQIVDTTSMRIVNEVNSIGRFALSPDERWLVGVGTTYFERPDEAGAIGHGAKVVDLWSREVVAHLRPGIRFWDAAVSADSRYAAFVSEVAPPTSRKEWRVRIEILDIRRGEVVAERRFRGHVGLASLVPSR